MISKKQPDVLRVVQYVLNKAAQNEAFSVQTAEKALWSSLAALVIAAAGLILSSISVFS